MTGVVEAYERYQQALSLYEKEADTAVFYFREMVHYSRLMQLIGLAYLFHRRDLLARIAALADTNFYGQDALYEELLDYALPDRMDTDQLFHARPYEHLVHAMYRDTDEESIEDLQKYVQAWYPAMKHVPWHDGHLRMTATDEDYFGYWAFEAGAVAFLCELDDSAITHMVYPKDLVAYARKLRDDGVTSPTPIADDYAACLTKSSQRPAGGGVPPSLALMRYATSTKESISHQPRRPTMAVCSGITM